jgi:hypothetical protein
VPSEPMENHVQRFRKVRVSSRERAVRTERVTPPVPGCVVLLLCHYYSSFGGTYFPRTDIRTVTLRLQRAHCTHVSQI